MLIRFRVQNFLSFKEKVEFSMLPGKARQRPGHIISGGASRNAVDLLRAATIYGANASGKSNLIFSIGVARDMVVKGTRLHQSLDHKPFKLDLSYIDKPSLFEFELRTGSNDYLYGFEFDSQQIHSEWLYRLKKTSQSLLFERHTDQDGRTKIEFGSLKLVKKERDFLDFVAMGTRSNQLFLTESVEREVKHYTPIYNWFQRSLIVIFPHTHYELGMIIRKQDKLRVETLVQYLEQFDTGVCGYDLEEVNPEKEFTDELLLGLKEKFGEKEQDIQASIYAPSSERYFVVKGQDKMLHAYKLRLKHRANGNNEAYMGLNEESDGTARLLDVIPVLMRKKNSGQTFLIDELDRSLHPALCYRLIELFLAAENDASQLIVTTHESNLLTFDLLRRDEIWFIEKNQQGASKIYSLEEFTPRYDKDIRKGYLLGRFGAIPMLGPVSFEG